MSYTVKIRKNSTGEIRDCRQDLEWKEGSLYWWTEGNFGCDCNRHLEFERAGNKDAMDDEIPCGDSLYTAISATLEDGTVIKINRELQSHDLYTKEEAIATAQADPEVLQEGGPITTEDL